MLTGLKQIRTEFGITQRKAAEELDVPYPTYRAWEQCLNVPRSDELVRLSEFFKVSIDDLFGRQDVSAPSAKLKSMTKTAPLYGEIHAGDVMEMLEIEDMVEVPARVLEKHPRGFYLRVVGDCMSKLYPEGSLVFIDPDVEPVNGDVVAVIVNGDSATLKKWYKTENSIVLSPSSYNAEYADVIYRDDDPNNPEIKPIGKAVFFMGSIE